MFGHDFGQDSRGSQVSVPSTMPLSQFISQSLSFSYVAPAGQQLSPFTRWVIVCVVWQAALQVPLPSSLRMLQRSWGQLFGQLVNGSQVSVGSWTLLPQIAWQSSSVLALQPA